MAGVPVPKCTVWGVNGYLSAAESVAKAYHRCFPNGKVVLSTWYFDRWANGEWEGITEKFNRKRPDWVDYILADDYGGTFPEYPLAHGSPGRLPMVNFPEISMYLTAMGRIRRQSRPAPSAVAVGYDEGQVSPAAWPTPKGSTRTSTRPFAPSSTGTRTEPPSRRSRSTLPFNFSPAVVDPVNRAIAILEKNIERRREDKDGVTRFVMKSTVGTDDAYRLIKDADAQLPDRERKSWRWRVVYLRGLIDSELARHEFRVSDRCESAFRELERLYHAERGYDTTAAGQHYEMRLT